MLKTRKPLERKKPISRGPKGAKKSSCKTSNRDKAAWDKHQRKWEKVCEDLAHKLCKFEGRCGAEGWEWNGKVYRCSERLEWAHLKSRRSLRIKYDPENFECLCNIHHKHFTHHPDDWVKFIDTKYPGRWDSLNAKLRGKKPFMDFELLAAGLYELLKIKEENS